MGDEGLEWSWAQCQEREEGELHDPRALFLLREVSPHQQEVEVVVACRTCGQLGVASLMLHADHAVDHEPTAPVRELVNLIRWTTKLPQPHESGDLKQRIAALRKAADELELLDSALRQGCCGRRDLRGWSETCLDCPRR